MFGKYHQPSPFSEFERFWDVWSASSEEHGTLDLKVMSSTPPAHAGHGACFKKK